MITFGIPTDLSVAGLFTLAGIPITPTGNRLQVGSTTNSTLMVADSGAWMNQASFIAASGGLQNQIAQSGQQAWSVADSNGRALSGNLTQTGIVLAALNLSTSGALYQQINLAAGVLSLNGATGAVTIANAGTNIFVSNSGTTIFVSGSGIAQASDLTISGQALRALVFGGDINLSGNLTTTGQILYGLIFNSSGLFAPAAANYVYITGAQTITGLKTFNSGLFFGNVGIGTTSPVSSLDVVGQGRFSNGLVLNSGLILGNSNATGGGVSWPDLNLFRSSANVLALNGTAPTFAFQDAGTQRAYIQTVSNSLTIAAQNAVILQTNANVTAATFSISGDALFARNVSAASGLFFADTGNYTRSGSVSIAQLVGISGVLAASISASAAGVSTLNTLSGALTLGGINGNSISISGQTIWVSGNGGSVLLPPSIAYLTGNQVFTANVTAKSYVSALSGLATPSMVAGASGRLNIDMAGAGLQTAIISGNTIISGINYSVGAATTLRLFSTITGVQLGYPAGWRFLSIVPPSSMTSGKLAILTLQSFDVVDSGIAAAWAIEP